MRLRLIRISDALSDSFWFLPALIALLAGGGALGLVALDHAVGAAWVRDMGWIWSGGAAGARAVLSVVAGSVMTVVSIVFSLTLTTLAQTSSHFGPRVLRNFTSDRGVQFTLGTFIATFVYCLVVLRTVRSVEEENFVPYLAVNVGVLLALASLGVLIYFIHHVTQGIQAENLIAAVGRDFQSALPVLFPERIGTADDGRPAPDEGHWKQARPVESDEAGYLQRVDETKLMALTQQHDLQVKLEKRPGDFVARLAPLLWVLPAASLRPEVESALRECFGLGDHRTPHQDALYSLQQLVEIAAHALSPGTNEPFTAVTCIDWLGNSLRAAAAREIPLPERRDPRGRLRVVARPVSFGEMVETAFDQIRSYGANSPTILISLLTTLSSLFSQVKNPEAREKLIRQLRLIEIDAGEIKNELERARVIEAVARTLELSAKPFGAVPALAP